MKETKEILDAIACMIYASVKAVEGGRFNIGAFTDYLNCAMKLPAAIKDADHVIEEFENMTKEQAEELRNFFLSKLNVTIKTNQVASLLLDSVLNDFINGRELAKLLKG